MITETFDLPGVLRGGLFDDVSMQGRNLLRRLKGEAAPFSIGAFLFAVGGLSLGALGFELLLRGAGITSPGVRTVVGIIGLGVGDSIIADMAEASVAEPAAAAGVVLPDDAPPMPPPSKVATTTAEPDAAKKTTSAGPFGGGAVGPAPVDATKAKIDPILAPPQSEIRAVVPAGDKGGDSAPGKVDLR